MENLIFGQKSTVLSLLGRILVQVIACYATVTETFAISDKEKLKDIVAIRRQRVRTDGKLLNGLTKTWISFSFKQRWGQNTFSTIQLKSPDCVKGCRIYLCPYKHLQYY